MTYIYQQLSAFTILLIAGMVLGAFFDLYRVFRSRIKVNGMIDGIGDIIFWLVSLVMMIPLLYWGVWLELRLYVWIAVTLGVFGYFFMFSRICIPVYRRFWISAMWLPNLLINMVYGLMLFVGRFIWRGAKSPHKTPPVGGGNDVRHQKK